MFSSHDARLRADSPPSVVTGAFVQFSAQTASASGAWWDAQLAAMAAAGFDTVVIQYVGSGDEYYYPATVDGAVAASPDAVGHVLAAAETHGVGVWLGLHLDQAFWQGKFDHVDRTARNEAVLKELVARYGRREALRGWYIPEEIDDLTEKRDYAAALLRYFRTISASARRQSQLPIAISPFFSRDVDPAAFAQWWDRVALPEISVQVLAMQDGVGTHRTTIEQAHQVLAALAPVAARHGVELWSNNECFDQTHGWPVDDQPWAARPAEFAGFQRQVARCSPLARKTITFEFTHYMSPEGDERARRLYQEYCKYRRNGAATRPHASPAPVVAREKAP